MRKKVVYMIASGADQRIAEIEKELGLDKLDVSLLDVVSSARNPDRGDKLTKALEEHEGVRNEEDQKKAEEESAALKTSSVKPDEIGLYGNPTA